MKHNLLLSLFALLSFASFAQVATTTYYFDKDLNLCPQSKSVYTGQGKRDGDTYRLDLQNKNEYHILTAHYTDSTFATMQGQFVSYYENGAVENMMNYKAGKPDGLAVEWTQDRKVTDSAWYNNGQADSIVKYSYDFVSLKVTSVERTNYINNTIVTTHFDDNGKALEPDASDITAEGDPQIEAHPDEEASFPGDDSAMNNYFQYKFLPIRGYLISRAATDGCKLSFVVDKNGKAMDVETEDCDNLTVKNNVSNAITDMMWLPATKNGKPVASIKIITAKYIPTFDGFSNDNQKKYFFDKNLNAVGEDDAEYMGKISKDGDLDELTVHYKQHSGKLYYIHYNETSQQTSGEFASFHYNGQKEMQGNFLMGQKDGWWIEWDEKGKVSDSSFYVDKMKAYESTTTYQPEGAPAKMVITDYAHNKKSTIYYDKRNVSADISMPIIGSDKCDASGVFYCLLYTSRPWAGLRLRPRSCCERC